MDAVEILRQVISNMTPENWHQGALDNSSPLLPEPTKWCVVGHLENVRLQNNLALIGANSEAREALNRIAGDDGWTEDRYPPIVTMNDDPATSFEDMVLTVKRAIELLETQYGN